MMSIIDISAINSKCITCGKVMKSNSRYVYFCGYKCKNSNDALKRLNNLFDEVVNHFNISNLGE